MIVIPMAGLSRRFSDAGYSLPKYMLPLDGRPVFDHAVGSFARYFDDTPFLFIARDVAGTADFLRARCEALGIASWWVATLDQETGGQAETVELGLLSAGLADLPLTIFNIDTFRRDFTFPDAARAGDGYLEVFRGSGANWSYVRPAGDGDAVVEVAEKRPISDLCCTGLYHFASSGAFLDALAHERTAGDYPELYVAPLYNHILRRGGDVRYALIERDQVVFCGVPAEYEALLAPGTIDAAAPVPSSAN